MKINITIEIDDEELKKFMTEEKQEKIAENSVSQYARWFGEESIKWVNNLDCNLAYLKRAQDYANGLLQLRKKLYLNDVYDMLGLSRTMAGNIVGWDLGKAESDGFAVSYTHLSNQYGMEELTDVT